MMNDIIENLKESNESIKKRLEKLKNSQVDRKIIDLLTDVLDGKEISEEISETEIRKYIDEENFTDEELERLDFIVLVINDNNIPMDESQKSFCDKIRKTIEKKLAKEADIPKLEKQVGLADNVIGDLEKDNHFENFDDLEELLNSIDMSNEEKLELLKSITISNIHGSKSLDLSDNKLVSEKKIIDLFSKFSLDYNKLTDELKLKLRKKIDIDNADAVLAKLQEKGINYKDIYRRSSAIFVSILNKSSVAIISDLENLSKTYDLDLKDIIKKNAQILYPNSRSLGYTKHKTSDSGNSYSTSSVGAYNYFKENVEFLGSKGMNIKEIYTRSQKIFVTNPDVLKTNYKMLTNIYNMNITSEDIGVGILSSRAIENFDRYIEATPIGYEYIMDNKSFLCASNDLDILKIKLCEQYHPGELFYKSYTDNWRKHKKDVYDVLPDNRLDLEKGLNISYTSTREKQEKRAEKFGYIKIEPLDKIPVQVMNQPLVKSIEEKNLEDDFTYLFNGTRISRPKFLRVCANMVNSGTGAITKEMVKFALAYNSILTDTDVNNIENFQKVGKKGYEGKGK